MTPDAISPEALLATTGIREILSGEPKHITVADKNTAEMMPREIRRAMVRFAAEDDGLKPIGKREAFDYGWVMEHLTDAIDPNPEAKKPAVKPELLEAIANCFRPQDHNLTTAYMARVQVVIPYLYTVMPVYTEQTVVRTKNYDPSDTEIARFRRAYDVCNDPMIVCRDMEAGTLILDQRQHLEACYPRMLENIKAQLAAAMADAMARKKSWKLPWRKERIVQLIYGTDTFSPELAKDLQANLAKMDEVKQGPPPAKSTGKIASMVQPATQATADGDIRT